MSAATRLRSSLPRLRGMLAYVAGPALGVLSGPILAHALGPDGRGQFASVMEPLTVAGAVATVGIPSAVTYFIARRESDPRTVYRFGLAVAVAPTLVVLGFLVWYSGEVAQTQGLPRLIYIAAWAFIVPSAVIQVRRAFWQGRAVWARLDAERLTFAVLRFAGVAAVAICGVTFAGGYVAAALLAFVLAALLLWLPAGEPREPRVAAPAAPRFVGFSLTASIGTISVVANNRLDQVLMPAQAASAEVGFYAVAVTVAEVPLVLAALAARNALQLASAGRSLAEILRDVALFVVTGVVLAVLLAALAPLYLPVVFGVAFGPSIPAVQILSASSILAILLVLATAVISGRGRPGLASLIPLTGLVTTIVGFAVGWGGIGATQAALVAVASQVASVLVAAPVLRIARRGDRAADPADTVVGGASR